MAAAKSVFEVGQDNCETLLRTVDKSKDMDEFLHTNESIAIHSTEIPNPREFFNFTFDTDGIVIEFHKVAGLQGGVQYLMLPRLRLDNMVGHYHILKKHVNLKRFSIKGLQSLKNCVGHTVSYVDGGYHLIMTCLPSNVANPDSHLASKEVYKLMALELLNNVVDNFKTLLRELPDKDKARPTLQKQGTFDTSKFHVLRRDCTFILSLLDKAVEMANACYFLQVVLFLTQFGQKDVECWDVSDIADPDQVRSMSVHYACNLVAKDPSTHVLFSRYSLQDLVGKRATLFSTLGMHEVTNMQSNLDNTPMDIDESLSDISQQYGELKFLQLYVDSAHMHINMPFKHPVSGAIVTCGLSHPNFQTAVITRGLKEKGAGKVHWCPPVLM